jgi:hydroxypyruvate reductase
VTDKPMVAVFPPIPQELRSALDSCFDVVVAGEDDLLRDIRVAVITSMGGADRSLMDRLPQLRLIACNGAGLERVDLDEAARRGVIIRNTPEEVTDDTADFAIALIYGTLRRLTQADRFVRAGCWETERMPPSRRVRGRRVGIVGLGKIGLKVAQRAAALGMLVAYTGPLAKPDAPFEFVPSLQELAARVDVLVLTCPGGPSTFRMVGEAVLCALGPEGVLINISRGEVVDEGALIAALRNGVISAAGLDVFENEPRISPALRELEQVILAPHYASVTSETRHDIAEALNNAILDFFAGRPVAGAYAG